MDMSEYNLKYKKEIENARKSGKSFPTEGMCHVVKEREYVPNDSCVECQNFYVENRAQWLKRVVDSIEKGESPWFINIGCDTGFQWLMEKLYKREKRKFKKLWKLRKEQGDRKTKKGNEIIREDQLWRKNRKFKDGPI